MGGSVWIGGESQTPGWNWKQQESTMLGRVGPETEEVQSIEEQGTLESFGISQIFTFGKTCLKLMLRHCAIF